MEYKICCVTGHRPQSFPWDYDNDASAREKYFAAMKAEAEQLVQMGYNYFISGGAIGVDMDFADIILELKKTNPDLQLEIAVPCANQDRKWKMPFKERYKRILYCADKVTVISEFFTRWCMQRRNEYMVDKSDLVVAFWNGTEKGGTFNTIKYARKKNKNIKYLPLSFFLETP